MMKFVLFLALAACGCTTCVVVTLSGATATEVAKITYSDSTWPILSYFSGPRFKMRVTKDYVGGPIRVEGSASLTNRTWIAGVYESEECKDLEVKAWACGTNDVTKAVN